MSESGSGTDPTSGSASGSATRDSSIAPDSAFELTFGKRRKASPKLRRVDLNEDNSFTSQRGHRLFFRSFLTKQPRKKGAIVWIHGIGDHCCESWHIWLGEYAALVGYDLWAMDLEGHGRSEPALRFYVKDYHTFIDDVEDFAKLVDKKSGKKLPLFLMGMSFGGYLSFQVALRWQENRSSAPKKWMGNVFLAPMLALPELPSAPEVFCLRYCCAPCCPTRAPFFMPDAVAPDQCIRDHDALAEYVNDPLNMGHQKLRLGTAVQLLQATVAARTQLGDVSFPFAVAQGTEDRVVPITASEELMDKSRTRSSDKAFYIAEGGYHDLLPDPDNKNVVRFVFRWMDQRVSSGKAA